MRFAMNARYQPDAEAAVPGEAVLIDPEAYDASEQQFAASLETEPVHLTNNIVQGPEPEQSSKLTEFAVTENPPLPTADPSAQQSESTIVASTATATAQQNQADDPQAWRKELAARLSNYRARRRPREHRYPSLRLKFEPDEPAPSVRMIADPPSSPPIVRSAVALERNHALLAAVEAPTNVVPSLMPPPANADEATARIIPFPRSAISPPRPLEELAEPVPGLPRILEVPDVAPPPPALGGILIEPAPEPIPERRPGFEVPLQAARLAPRLLAAIVDGLLVLLAGAMAGWIFFQIALSMPPLRELPEMVVAGLGILWFGYQYLLVVKSGTTPGLKLARLRLSRFDGRKAPWQIRRLRMLGSILSAASLGLGYAWCLLDEDQLCWHDRITRTYLAAEQRPNVPTAPIH